ncbi:MAG: BrnT family toxin [Pyrinomonadaceae bacterium]
MKITNVIWLTQFVEKIERKHGVSVDEVEEVFANRARFKLMRRGIVSGENLYRALGQTDSGRYLAVFFIYKGQNHALVVSAREADSRERRSYGKQKK